MVEAGYHVTLIAPHANDEAVQGVRILALPSVSNRISRMTIRAFRVYQLAKQLNADLYHFHDPELIPVGLLLKKGGSRVIYDIHEDAPRALLSPGHYYLPACSKKIVSSLMEILENYSSRFFTACISATPYIANRFRRFQKRTHVINNYPILDELIEVAHTPWNVRKNAIVYLGGIALTRGLREMVQAMEYLPNTLGARLKLAGNFSPPDCRLCVDHLSGWRSIDEQGYLDRREIKQLLSQVKVGLVLIHPEQRYIVSQPTKLFEFMSAGIPVIASDFPLWREIIKCEGCGLVVDPLDPHAIAAAIEYLLTHDNEAEEMGRRGRQAIEQRYNWPIEAEKLINIYHEILSSP